MASRAPGRQLVLESVVRRVFIISMTPKLLSTLPGYTVALLRADVIDITYDVPMRLEHERQGLPPLTFKSRRVK